MKGDFYMIRLKHFILLIDGTLYNSNIQLELKSNINYLVKSKLIDVISAPYKKYTQYVFYIIPYTVQKRYVLSCKFPFIKKYIYKKYGQPISYNKKIVYFLSKRTALNLINYVE